MIYSKPRWTSKGFTIVELLTVISVIAILIGLVVPSLNHVRNKARDVQQNAQFHSIAVALEMFRNDEEYYPESHSGSNYEITGSHILAEALVGRDLQGFDPKSTFNPDDDYAADAGVDKPYDVSATGKTVSLARRKGPYLNMDRGGAYDLKFVYDGITALTSQGIYYDSTGANSEPAPVLTDVYRTKKVEIPVSGSTTLTTSVKLGAPILYFKANIASTQFANSNSTGGVDSAKYTSYIYNYNDNWRIFDLGPIKQNVTAAAEPFSSTKSKSTFLDDFYDAISNPQVTTIQRPYNPDSYILLSAGNDGIYGTSDDIWNFGN